MNMEVEIWKPVENYPNYEISNFGHLRKIKNKRLLKGYKTYDGYIKHSLTNENGSKVFREHILTANAFIPDTNPQIKTEINHIDGDKTNNRVDNLERITHKENILHYHTNKIKEKPTKQQQVLCKETGIIFKTMAHAARATGVSYPRMWYALHGKQKSSGGFHWSFVGE